MTSNELPNLSDLGKRAKAASRLLTVSTAETRNNALIALAQALDKNRDEIFAANKLDIEFAKSAGLSDSLIDRLTLNDKRIDGITDSVRQIAASDEVIGRVIAEYHPKNGLHIKKVAVPLGVIGVIFEARPNVTADSAALCIKSGNVVVLRGGKEAINSNTKIAELMRAAIASAGLPKDAICFIDDTSRGSSVALMHLSDYVDVLIPRGSKGLINAVKKEASVPVIETGAGTCHTYVDKAADISMAVNIINNAKTSRPSVCNALECVLIHRDIADKAIPKIAEKLLLNNPPVKIHGDDTVLKLVPSAIPATSEDFGKEYLDYELLMLTVNDISEAVDYIYKNSTKHSECIVTNDSVAADFFMSNVDSAAVYLNASTRFTDGGEFGFGAEIGISTQKLHARGPLGLSELTSYKYEIFGKGEIR